MDDKKLQRLREQIDHHARRGDVVAVIAQDMCGVMQERIEALELALREAWPYVPDHHGPVQHKIKTALNEP